MKLNFKDERYKRIAMQSKKASESEITHDMSDAFMLLLKGVKKEDLSYFSKKIQEELRKNDINLNIEDCYSITQGKWEDSSISQADIEKVIGTNIGDYLLKIGYDCIEKDGMHLGENVINGTTINTSSWISHSLFEAKAAQMLAKKMGLDEEKTGIMALLHDYGRKFTHDFSHVTRGFEALVDEGWIKEARSTITHSFINAGRCANCDPAEDGFYIDENGNPSWEETADKDDVTEVLETLEYDDYDMILNIADLMATDKGIVSPFDRVQDVATRKAPDLRNRGYFLSEFTNKLIYAMKKMNSTKNLEELTPLMNLEEINDRFKNTSQVFYEAFLDEKTVSISKLASQAVGKVATSDLVELDDKTNTTKENETGEKSDE